MPFHIHILNPFEIVKLTTTSDPFIREQSGDSAKQLTGQRWSGFMIPMFPSELNLILVNGLKSPKTGAGVRARTRSMAAAGFTWSIHHLPCHGLGSQGMMIRREIAKPSGGEVSCRQAIETWPGCAFALLGCRRKTMDFRPMRVMPIALALLPPPASPFFADVVDVFWM